MARSKSLCSLIAVVAFCAVANASFAFPKRPPFPHPITCGPSMNGCYGFYFWDPDYGIAGSGYFCAASENNPFECDSFITEGLIDCNADSTEYLSEIVNGGVSLFDGEGTMYFETVEYICGLEPFIEFDVALVSGGNTVLLNTNGSKYVLGNEYLPNAGYGTYLRGRADNDSQTEILNGCYNLSFWWTDGPTVGNCTLCFGQLGSGVITGGDCRCNAETSTEVSSTIASGEYFLEAATGTGFLFLETSGGDICGFTPYLGLDFALANGGTEIVGNCDGEEFISIDGDEFPNTGYDMPCAFEGYRY